MTLLCVCVGLNDRGSGRKQARADEKHKTPGKLENPACTRNVNYEITECIVMSYPRRLD